MAVHGAFIRSLQDALLGVSRVGRNEAAELGGKNSEDR